jgi:hypothetical protein
MSKVSCYDYFCPYTVEDTRNLGTLESYQEYERCLLYTSYCYSVCPSFAAKEWIEVFREELNADCRNGKSSVSCQIMIRPPFPQWYRGVQVPEHFPKSELIASVFDTWKVGDWVEWLYDDCYWTAKIVKVLSKDEVKVISCCVSQN